MEYFIPLQRRQWYREFESRGTPPGLPCRWVEMFKIIKQGKFTPVNTRLKNKKSFSHKWRSLLARMKVMLQVDTIANIQ